MKRFFLFIFTGLMVCLGFAQIPEDYYLKVNGLKKGELKSAMRSVVGKANVLGYGSGEGRTWTGFYTTDRYDGNKVRDRYSYDVRYFPSTASAQAASAVNGMNIEHSFPKSWWGGAENQAYKDLFNLMPCESSINSSKSNYAMGVVSTVKTSNGCTKVGTGKAGAKNASLWEPADEWKGDFARGYFYMVTAYSNLTWTGEALTMLENNEWPTMQEWAYKLLLEWSRQDPVDEIEVERNEAVFGIQGNRNPFIDFPNLAEYIWGDSTEVAFSVDGSTPIVNPEKVDVAVYQIDFTKDCSGWDIVDKKLPEGMMTVWTQTSAYGMKASAYANSTTYAAESWLVSPVMDLTELDDATLTFSHTGRYFGDMKEEATLWVCRDGNDEWEQLPINTYMSGTNWQFVENKTALTDYRGEKVRLAFRYKSSSQAAATWELRSVKVDGVKKIVAPVEQIMAYEANEIVCGIYSCRFDANWSKFANDAVYVLDVYRKDEAGVKHSLEGFPVETTECTYRVSSGVKPNTTYYYTVQVCEDGEVVAQSNEIRVDVPSIPPSMSVSPAQLSFTSPLSCASKALKVSVTLINTPEKTVSARVDGPFEMASTEDATTWEKGLTLTGENVTFYVRQAAVEEEGEIRGTLTVSTLDVEPRVIPLLGSVDNQKAFFENFETGTKNAYDKEANEVSCVTGTWRLYNALLGNSDTDTFNDTKSVRMKAGGSVEMLFDKSAGCDSLWFWSGLYYKDKGVKLTVSYSLDEGQTWDPVVSELEVDTWQRYGYELHVDGNVRVKFEATGTAGKRLHLDDIQMNDYREKEEDVVQGIGVEPLTVQVCYDLQGRCLKHLPKHGIFIVNGRKVVR